jgi:renalase
VNFICQIKTSLHTGKYAGTDRGLMKKKNVGIIGAGIAGLACANPLRREGISVTVFEKSRGPGGRSSTRHLEQSSCDHGAQYFTITDPLFAERVFEWRDQGVVDVWRGRLVVIDDGVVRDLNEPRERLVGTPGMKSIGKYLARNLDLRKETRVERVEPSGRQWTVVDATGVAHGPFDALISTAPPLQTSELFSEWSPSFADQLDRVEMLPCWSVMLTFAARLPVHFDGAFVNGSPLNWIARNNSKPGRPPQECWLLHASPEWSLENLNWQTADVEFALIAEFQSLLGEDILTPLSVTSHRWRYARPRDVLPPRYLFDEKLQIGTAGDWCGGPRIEGAFLSGHALATHLLEM